MNRTLARNGLLCAFVLPLSAIGSMQKVPAIFEGQPEIRLIPNGSVTEWYFPDQSSFGRIDAVIRYTEKCKIIEMIGSETFDLRDNRYLADEDYDGFTVGDSSRVLCGWDIDLPLPSENFRVQRVRLEKHADLSYRGPRNIQFSGSDNYNSVIDSVRKALSRDETVAIDVDYRRDEVERYILPAPIELIGVPLYVSELVEEDARISQRLQEDQKRRDQASRERQRERDEEQQLRLLWQAGGLLFLAAVSLTLIWWVVRNRPDRWITNASRKLIQRVKRATRAKPKVNRHVADELLAWSELRDKGDITQEEFENLKAQLLSKNK